MHVLVIGAGAVGGLLGGRAALAGHQVTLTGRAHFVAAVRRAGLTLVEADGTRRAAPVSAVESLAEAFQRGATYDIALLTVKAYDTAGAADELRAATAAPPPILTLQNGVGNEEQLAQVFGLDAVVAGAIDTPVSVPSPGVVVIRRNRFRAGLARVGLQSPLAAALSLLREAGLDATTYDDYRRLKWSKLLLNLPANALCAILDWSPAQVMAHPLAARLEGRAWQEAFRVMHRLGVRPLALAGYPLSAVAPFVRRLPPALLARLMARTVAGGRGGKQPSLRMALNAGQRSEVTWLNGAVAAYARQLGAPAPVNAAYTQVLTALTEGHAPRDAWRGRPERLAVSTG
jgi:2-dehydropantoate 2-reductase